MSDTPPGTSGSDPGRVPDQPAATPPPPPPAPAPAAGYGAAPSAGQPAGLGLRFAAKLIDFILIFIVNLVVFVPVVVGNLVAGQNGANPFFSTGFSAGAVVASLVLVILELAYFVFLEQSRGQTLGKMAVSIKAVGPGGANPTTGEAFKRNAWLLLSIIPVIGGLAWLGFAIAIAVTISNDPANRGIHDRFAGGTQVVRTK